MVDNSIIFMGNYKSQIWPCKKSFFVEKTIKATVGTKIHNLILIFVQLLLFC